MNDAEHPIRTNFVRQIIDEDQESAKHDGRVATRFPPEPNGYLHIGHAKSIVLNFGIAEDYKGICNLRFDDTNPHKENLKFVEAIQQDVRWLGYEWNERLFFASDYFEPLFDFAIQLINKGKAYVDDLSAEQIREYRGTLTQSGKNSPHRDRSVDENLKLFQGMKSGEFSDFITPGFIQFFARTFGKLLLIVRVIKDQCSIMRTSIRELAIVIGGIDLAPKRLKEILVGNNVGVEMNPHTFDMPGAPG